MLPIFVIGCIFTSISKQNLKLKILTILTPIILYIPSTILFLKAYNYTNPKEFLIPENYSGPLRIVYEEKCGKELKKENGKEIFKFPENGILILSSKFDGKINHKYYFVDKKGNKKEIPQTNINGENLKFPNVSIDGAGNMSNGEIKIGVNSNDDKDNIKYSDFFVHKNQIADFDFKEEQKFNDLTILIVNNCRKK